MLRLLFACCGIATLTGCMAPAVLAPLRTPSVETVRLFGKELVPTETAVRDEVLRLISPGMPMEQAAALLKVHGLEPRAYPLTPPAAGRAFALSDRDLNLGALQCFAYPAILGEWGRRYVAIRVVVTPDAADAVNDVSVQVCGPCANCWASFFEPRPALQEPVGLPVAEAQARMQAAGFQCSVVTQGARGRRYLNCLAVAEQAPRRRLLAIRLYCDECGVVRDTEIVPGSLPELRLFGKALLADEWLLRDEMLRIVCPGMPMDQAATALKGHGLAAAFGLFHGPALEFQIALRNCHRIPRGRILGSREACYIASAEDVNAWGRVYWKVMVVLVPDAAQVVKEVKVIVSLPLGDRCQAIFAERPDLQDPVGLPLTEVKARMESAAFRCSFCGGDAESRGRPYLYCWQRVENPLDGYVLRVRLYHDEAGVVRETEILREDRWFEAERCMLPAAEDSAEWFALRAALFPVRVSCRYTFMMLVLALSNHHGGRAHAHVGVGPHGYH